MSRRLSRNVSLGYALRMVIRSESGTLNPTCCGPNGHSLATNPGPRRISASSFVGQRSDVAVAAEGYSYVFLSEKYLRYGADAALLSEHCARRDGKRLWRTRRTLRKSHGQWRTTKLLGNDGGSSSIALRHARSCLS